MVSMVDQMVDQNATYLTRPLRGPLYLESLGSRRHKISCFHKSNNFRRLAAF